MCDFDFFSVEATSNSIRALMKIGNLKRESIKTRLIYGGRFPKQF